MSKDRIPVVEIMRNTPVIRKIILEGVPAQLAKAIASAEEVVGGVANFVLDGFLPTDTVTLLVGTSERRAITRRAARLRTELTAETYL